MKRFCLRRRRPATVFGLAVIALSFVLTFPCPGQTAATYHSHADQALQSFLLKFWNGGSQYLRNMYPDNGSLTGYWTYAHGWDAVMDGVERTGGQQYAGLIESFYLGQNARGWTNGYYDDECWMTAALIRAYDLTGKTNYLNQATALYADIMTGWDTTCCGSVSGGMWWDKAHTQKATAANAGTALAGARLYARTGNLTYLNFSRQVYSFWFTNMVDQSTFQVCDHINTDGTKVWWKFTYNEGLMIGASIALFQATSDGSYITKAYSIAGFVMANELASTAYGSVLSDGSNSSCGGDCHEFKAPAYRYFMQLYALNTHNTQYYSVLKSSADAIWNLARNSTSTVFSVSWAGPFQTNVDQLQDNAACIALSRFAQQYGPYPGSGIPANQYEAENATLHNLGLEAIYGGFTGWGYIAGWNGNGQSVDFKVNCPYSGHYTLVFRYAGGAGNASRLIAVNGYNTFPNQSFLGTGAWSSYTNLPLSCILAAGTNTISVSFTSALGSANWLNLDNLTVVPDPPESVVLTGIAVMPAGVIRLTWTSIPTHAYQVQFSSDLSGWTNLGIPITATFTTTSLDDATATGTFRYYRVISVN